jgi:hypothetical protein
MFNHPLNFFLTTYLLFTCLFLHSIDTAETDESHSKTVLLAILARNKAHVLPDYFKCIGNLDYNKKLITIYINTNNNIDNTETLLEEWAQLNRDNYKKIIFDKHHVENLIDSRPHEWTAQRFSILAEIRNKSLEKALENGNDYYFVVDCDNFIAPYTLKELLLKDKPIIAPLLKPIPEKNDYYSNYFCDVSENGYYQNHPDYNSIFLGFKQGNFKVPVVHCTYLINTKYINQLNYADGSNDYEFVIFSRLARAHNVDQYICNEKNFGYLLHFQKDLTLEEEKDSVKDLNIENMIKKCS